MFTGIIEAKGIVKEVLVSGSNKTFWVTSPLSEQFSIDQSVSHNGVCLTVEEVQGDMHRVTAIDETLSKTNLNDWQPGSLINLERCLQMHGRLDGHIVQGHVDAVGTCVEVLDKQGSWEYTFEFDAEFAKLVIEKGSIAVNGISLTLFDVTKTTFRVAIIPYTYEHTNLQQVSLHSRVNIEYDMIGKYVNRFLQFR